MKKLLAFCLAVVVVFTVSIAFAQGGVISQKPSTEKPFYNVISTKGKIKEISNGKVRVVGEGAYDEIVLTIHENTYILDAESGTQISYQKLKENDVVTAYYGPVVTKSIPPQGSAIALIVGSPEKGSAGMYMKVAEIENTKDGSIRVLSSNSDRLVTIKSDIFAQFSDVKEGSELLVWYEIMTMSIPAHATATKVVLLPTTADIRIHTGTGNIVVNGRELVLSAEDKVERDENTLRLPLRVIAENLGYDVTWHDDTKVVELQKGSNIVATMTIGSNLYGKSETAQQMEYAPKLVDGKTLVPVEFFTQLMNVKVDISDSPIQ